MSENTQLANTQAAKRNGEFKRRQDALLPPVDVIEDASGITLLADIPGVSRDKLNIRVESDRLTIEGEVDISLPQGAESSYAEVQVPRYQRSFSLSRELDSAQISAELKNGVLRLRIPKAAHAQPRKIEVRAS